MHKGPGDRGSLHFSAAHLVREGSGPMAETDEIEHFHRSGPRLARRVPAQKQGKLDVLQRGHGRKKVEKLEDDAEPFAPVGG